MQQESRIGNASRNMLFGMMLKLYQILLPFIIRTAIMYYMGLEYLGLNSLFGSLLWVLNLAELGVGSAMVYSMYQPIIDGDSNQICALLNLYKKYYRIIGVVIATIGLVITPFIPYLIKKDIPEDTDVYVVYLLNLFSTVLSYWLFAYKQSILVAHQRSDLVSKVRLITNSLMYGAQVLVIIFFKDYYLYLIIAIIQQIITNFIVAFVSAKKYPQYKAIGKLDDRIITKINGRIKDLFLTKLGAVIVSSADSIVISAFLGLSLLAIYNNYYYILTAAMSLVKVVFDSCMSGIGNSILTDTREKVYKDLNTLTFIVLWLVGVCAVCLLCLLQPTMKIWAGEDKLLGFNVIICFIVYFLVDQLNQLFLTYKDAAGIWHEDRFRPIVTALVNLLLNIVLVQFIGIYGVILSTVISVVCVGMPWILYNLSTTLFKRSLKGYTVRLLGYVGVIGIVATITLLVCNCIPDGGILLLLVKAAICVIVSNILFLLAYFKTKAFQETKAVVIRILHRG
ncbi:MAG: lipopolysaccharide biosynthesis protein [Wujia sp.]